MKNHVKVAVDTLHGLGFHLDHKDRELRGDRWIFTHPNEPDARLTLNYYMSNPAVRTVLRKAEHIVGLASSDTKTRKVRKDDARRKAERHATRLSIEAARRAAAAKDAEQQARRHADAIGKHRRELDQLMRGHNQGAAGPLPGHHLLTIEEAADWSGAPDKAIRRAIENQKLEAYQCGQVVKVKGADVREWWVAS